MVTIIRLNKEIQRRLKIKSAKTGLSQLELANKYISEGLKNDSIDFNCNKRLKEIDKLLNHDKPEGNHLKYFANLVTNEINEVKEKKEVYKRFKSG